MQYNLRVQEKWRGGLCFLANGVFYESPKASWEPVVDFTGCNNRAWSRGGVAAQKRSG